MGVITFTFDEIILAPHWTNLCLFDWWHHFVHSAKSPFFCFPQLFSIKCLDLLQKCINVHASISPILCELAASSVLLSAGSHQQKSAIQPTHSLEMSRPRFVMWLLVRGLSVIHSHGHIWTEEQDAVLHSGLTVEWTLDCTRDWKVENFCPTLRMGVYLDGLAQRDQMNGQGKSFPRRFRSFVGSGNQKKKDR